MWESGGNAAVLSLNELRNLRLLQLFKYGNTHAVSSWRSRAFEWTSVFSAARRAFYFIFSTANRVPTVLFAETLGPGQDRGKNGRAVSPFSHPLLLFPPSLVHFVFRLPGSCAAFYDASTPLERDIAMMNWPLRGVWLSLSVFGIIQASPHPPLPSISGSPSTPYLFVK